MRQDWIMSPWLFNVYMDAVLKEVKGGMGKMVVRFQEEGREWRLFGLLCYYLFRSITRLAVHAVLYRRGGLLYEDYLVSCGESEEDL